MATQLSFGRFPLINEAAKNEADRPGTLMLEYFEASFTISSLESTAEVPTTLGEVLGVISLNFIAAASDPTDVYTLLTDGVITTGAVTVNLKALDIADGAITVKGFLVGKKAETVLTLG
jgi:hypothetical protein